MRVVFAGTPEVALPSLEAVAASSHDLVAVVTRPDAPSGRGRSLAASPVSVWARERGIPVLCPARPSEPEFLATLADLAPDCCPVVAYGALVPAPALRIPRLGWVNLHFSLLPAWRGAAPVQRSLMAGDDVTGATTFLLEEGLDTGPVFGTLTEQVRPRDTAGTLLERLAAGGAGLLLATLDGLDAGRLTPRPQPSEGVSSAPKVDVAEAEIRWGLPGHVVDRRVRGCTPAPGAWTTFRGERVKVGPVEPVDAVAEAHRDAGSAPPPGTLLVGKREVLVATGSGPVRLTTVRPTGRRAMDAADWARGVRPEPGEVFA